MLLVKYKPKYATELQKSCLGNCCLLFSVFQMSFFSESMMDFSCCPKNVPKTIRKSDFEIAFSLESADSNCTAVSKGGKIQNTKPRIEHSKFLGQ